MHTATTREQLRSPKLDELVVFFYHHGDNEHNVFPIELRRMIKVIKNHYNSFRIRTATN